MIKIRIAKDTDFVQWLPLWKGYQTFYKTSISEETTAITWSRLDSLLQQSLHAHPAQKAPAAKQSQYILRQRVFLQEQARGSPGGLGLGQRVRCEAQLRGGSGIGAGVRAAHMSRRSKAGTQHRACVRLAAGWSKRLTGWQQAQRQG